MYDQLGKALHSLKKSGRRSILLIAHELTSSGSSLLLSDLCKYYAHQGYTVIVLTEYAGPPAEVIQDRLACASAVIRLHFRHSTRMRALRMLSRAGARQAIGNTVLSGTFADELHEAGIRGLYLIHEMRASLGILNAKGITRRLAECGDLLVFPTETVRDSFFRYAQTSRCGGDIQIIPQGCRRTLSSGMTRAESRSRLRTQLSAGPNARILVGAGAVNFGKGVDLWLPLLKKLIQIESNQPFHMVWLGDANERDAFYLWLNVQIQHLGLEERVHFMGFITDEAQYASILEGSDAFFLSSREDSFPSVVIEAMAARLPILAYTGSGGGADYVKAAHSGICVPMGDADAAQEAVLELCNHSAAYANSETVEKARRDFFFPDYADKIIEQLQKTM